MSVLPAKSSICIVSHNAYGAISGGKSGFIGGVEWQTSLTARWFAHNGYQVSMLTWDEGGPEEEVFDGVRVIKICRESAAISGLRFFHPKWTGLIKAMRRADADVYYHNSAECVTGQIAMWCQRNSRAFVFSLASEADCDPRLPELGKSIERKLYLHGLRNATARISQTQTQYERLIKNFGIESTVIPMPCPDDGRPSSTPVIRDSKRVLWVGRVCKVKRPDRLLALAESSPELNFDLVGPFVVPECGERTRNRAARIPNLRVLGPVPKAQMSEMYRQSALLCCTSDYEGFPNTFLEAWSHGIPVVATVNPDGVITRHRLGAVANSVPELRAAIKSLLGSPQEYDEISQNARKYYADNHTVEAVFPRYEAVFRRAMLERHRF